MRIDVNAPCSLASQKESDVSQESSPSVADLDHGITLFGGSEIALCPSENGVIHEIYFS